MRIILKRLTLGPVKEPMPEADNYDHEAFDKYIGAEVILPKGNQYLLGMITVR
jgi:hypothetical protein